ncbi:hypothetical protein SAMN02745220_00372 [Desulfopila aestuarii DSM 18488]|uniref:Uncharacterized protein n=2 Tax=Desulfopila aestuarii TaxID=231440 RepID=A0A1M7XX36_9BACT|nr:hypothetical protein SAMN02745220_00372 [Desulfopila aestuarii DSM 18488]
MRAEFKRINKALTEYLHSESNMLIFQIDKQQLIKYGNDGFLKLFRLIKMPTGAGFVDFFLPGSDGLIFETGSQEFVCNPRTGLYGRLAFHKIRHDNELTFWSEPRLATVINRTTLKAYPSRSHDNDHINI